MAIFTHKHLVLHCPRPPIFSTREMSSLPPGVEKRWDPTVKKVRKIDDASLVAH